MLPRLVSNSWPQAILPSRSPKSLELQERATAPRQQSALTIKNPTLQKRKLRLGEGCKAGAPGARPKSENCCCRRRGKCARDLQIVSVRGGRVSAWGRGEPEPGAGAQSRAAQIGRGGEIRLRGEPGVREARPGMARPGRGGVRPAPSLPHPQPRRRGSFKSGRGAPWRRSGACDRSRSGSRSRSGAGAERAERAEPAAELGARAGGMYRARAARAGPEPGSPGRFGILSTGQLRDLLQDEPKLDRIVRLSRKFQGLQLEREACLASNYALAKENLALRPRLEMGRAALAIKYQELREVAENCADKLQRLEESMHRWSPHCALGWLQAELEEAEQEAEMEQLLLGEQSLEAFLPAFQRGRALAHLRRTQAEKLQELLRRRERSAQPAPTSAADPPKSFPAAAVLPTGAARGPPAVPRSLPPLDSRPVPPLKGSPGCPLGPAPLLSPRPSQPEPPHR
ncbi:vacuolar protein sorting-associated protein 37D isoform X2 [Macaca mulatta]